MQVTIKDIALDTGLSIATVSKYLNGKSILRENEQAIRASIERLHYAPNPSAQKLRSKHSKVICLLMPEVFNYFWGGFCDELEKYLQERGYSLLLRSYRRDDRAFAAEFSASLHGIDGVIYIPTAYFANTLGEELRSYQVPVICIDMPAAGDTLITSDNYESTRRAVAYLFARGHTNLGVLCISDQSYTMRERLRGVTDACQSHGAGMKPVHVLRTGGTTLEDADILAMVQAPNHPTAVLSLSYNITMQLIQLLSNCTVAVPQDFSLISFDDDETFAAFAPPLTVIRQDQKTMAVRAGACVLAKIAQPDTVFADVFFVPTRFIERASVTDLKNEK